jgi:curved DNA-binding protein
MPVTPQAAEFIRTLGLELGRNYNPDEIKRAWKAKCAACHPDKGGDQAEFIKITHAYKMLTDPDYRQKNHAAAPAGAGLDITIQYIVSFEDAFFGKVISINHGAPVLGDGGASLEGARVEVDYLTFRLPVGSVAGHRETFRGKGSRFGKTAGDLHVAVSVNPHPTFKVEGRDVHATVPVPLDILLKGGKVEVLTMYGIKTMKVPAGTRPNDRLAIKRCGVGKAGDHVATVSLVFPSKEELKYKDAWSGLNINWSEPSEDQEEDRLNKLFSDCLAKKQAGVPGV